MVIVPVIIVGSIGLLFGIGFGIVSKKLRVHSDPRIEKIESVLPNTNCGVCGYPGCSAFAQAVSESKTEITGCIPGGPETADRLEEILGIDVQPAEAMMAVVHCKGGINETRNRSLYEGIKDCNAAVLAGNGSKVCSDGCLGLGTCVQACPFDALYINDNSVAVVVPEKCSGCGQCVSVCPRNIIEIIPKVHKIFIACSNHEHGTKIKKYCSVGCTSCTLCIKATPSGAITMENNLPILDYSKGENFISAAYKCPSKCFADLVKARPKGNIDTKCDGCGKCVPVCPVKGAVNGESGDRHTIDKNKCIGCGICLDSCHIHAISLWGGLGYSLDDKSKRQRS